MAMEQKTAVRGGTSGVSCLVLCIALLRLHCAAVLVADVAVVRIAGSASIERAGRHFGEAVILFFAACIFFHFCRRRESKMFLTGYTKYHRRVLFSVPPILLTLVIILSFIPSYNNRLNGCYITRGLEKPQPVWIPLRDSALHNLAVLLMWLGMLTLSLLPTSRFRGIFDLLHASAAFHSTYIFLCASKALLNDIACGGRDSMYPNGISGHYCYFIYVSLCIPLLARERLDQNASNSSNKNAILFASVCIAGYAIAGAATLYRTFAHGYHSPRQILLGSALGIASHSALEFLAYSTKPRTKPLVLLRSQILASLFVFALYFLTWPKRQVGPAISAAQIVFHTALLVGMAVTAAFAQEEKLDTRKEA